MIIKIRFITRCGCTAEESYDCTREPPAYIYRALSVPLGELTKFSADVEIRPKMDKRKFQYIGTFPINNLYSYVEYMEVLE